MTRSWFYICSRALFCKFHFYMSLFLVPILPATRETRTVEDHRGERGLPHCPLEVSGFGDEKGRANVSVPQTPPCNHQQKSHDRAPCQEPKIRTFWWYYKKYSRLLYNLLFAKRSLIAFEPYIPVDLVLLPIGYFASISAFSSVKKMERIITHIFLMSSLST